MEMELAKPKISVKMISIFGGYSLDYPHAEPISPQSQYFEAGKIDSAVQDSDGFWFSCSLDRESTPSIHK